MKKTNRIVTIALMICMAITSGGLLYATMYASGAGTQSTQTTMIFDASSGIRYNELTRSFEVFSGVGVSWIGSDGWVSTLGEYSKDTTPKPTQTQTSGVWYQATKTSTYRIMCDISYSSVFVEESTTEFVTEYNAAFNNRITLEEGGKIDGGDFLLSGFPVMTNSSYSSALVVSNAGVIRNIKMSDVDFDSITSNSVYGGIICGENKATGVIAECEVYGTYTTARFTYLFSIAASSSGTIMNCINNANLTNAKTLTSYTAGIARIGEGSNTINNINNGKIEGTYTTSYAAGIATCSNVDLQISGNVNNGEITAVTGAAGIAGGSTSLTAMRAFNNTNNGKLQAAGRFVEYTGQMAELEISGEEVPVNGIRWNPDALLFEVYNTAGVSHIAMMHWISSEGQISTTEEDGYEQASRTSHYKIMNNIVYNESEEGFFKGFKDVSLAPDGRGPILLRGGIVDGGGWTLFDFPIRVVGKMNSRDEIFASGLFFATAGIVQNMNLRILNTIWDDSKGTVDYIGGLCGIGTYSNMVTVGGDITVLSGVTAGVGGHFGIAGTRNTDTAVSYIAGSGVILPSETRDCLSFVNISGDVKYAGGFFGQLEGHPSYTQIMHRLINFGNITATEGAGGITGPDYYSYYQRWYVDIVNFGDIRTTSTTGDGAGGLYSKIQPASSSRPHERLENYGNVESKTNAGGILAFLNENQTASTFKNVLNFGDVKGGGENTTGAVLGWVHAPKSLTTITDSYNNGAVGIATDMKTGDAVRFVGNMEAYWNGGGEYNISREKPQ